MKFSPAKALAMHGHATMEIISYVRDGAVSHQESIGNVGVTKVGDVQVMSAGTGIRHAEHNKGARLLKLFQI